MSTVGCLSGGRRRANDQCAASLRPRVPHLHVSPFSDLAMRIEPQVWRLLHIRRQDGRLRDLGALRVDDISASVAIGWLGTTSMEPLFAPLVHAAHGADSNALGAEPQLTRVFRDYKRTNREVVALDTQQRLRGYQIPLTLHFYMMQGECFLRAVIATGNVATTRGGNHEAPPCATYFLEGITVGAGHGTRDHMEAIEALGVRFLAASDGGLSQPPHPQTLEEARHLHIFV